jgi:hypothetical protein
VDTQSCLFGGNVDTQSCLSVGLVFANRACLVLSVGSVIAGPLVVGPSVELLCCSTSGSWDSNTPSPAGSNEPRGEERTGKEQTRYEVREFYIWSVERGAWSVVWRARSAPVTSTAWLMDTERSTWMDIDRLSWTVAIVGCFNVPASGRIS